MLHFHDDTFAATNKSQTISETYNSEKNLLSKSPERKTSRKTKKNLIECKCESKERKRGTSKQQKFQKKLIEKMKHQNKKNPVQRCMIYHKI